MRNLGRLGATLLVAWFWGLAAVGDTAVQEALGDLKSKVVRVRAEAALRLGRLGDPSAVKPLAAALSDPAPSVRREAAKALGRVPGTGAVPALIKALGDTDQNVRFYAAYALGQRNDRRAVPALSHALDDPVWLVRSQAAWALREIEDPSVVKAMMSALADPRANSDQIIWILENHDRDTCISQLLGLLENPKPLARRRAIEALDRFGDKQAVEPLLKALGDADAGVRLAAVKALGDLGDPRGDAPLRKLETTDPDRRVREAARQVEGGAGAMDAPGRGRP